MTVVIFEAMKGARPKNPVSRSWVMDCGRRIAVDEAPSWMDCAIKGKPQ
jgi:hypothetical protein